MNLDEKEAASVKLKDYRLFFDGSIEVNSDSIVEFLLKNGDHAAHMFVDIETEDVKQYNKYSLHKLKVKERLDDIDLSWNIPDKYKNLNIEDYLKSINLETDRLALRIERRDRELSLFKKYELENILKLVIYIVDVLTEKNIVWGTGRGSSCSSYLFYLIGLHCVDVVKYDIPIHDFFKNEKIE